MPLLAASRVASASTAMVQPTMIWLQSLVACPAPSGPIWVSRAAMVMTCGRARSTSAASPPAMIASEPSSAPLVPLGAKAEARGRPRG